MEKKLKNFDASGIEILDISEQIQIKGGCKTCGGDIRKPRPGTGTSSYSSFHCD